MKKFYLINNETQVANFGRRENGLCYVNILTNGDDLSDLSFSNEKLNDIRNLLGIQFKVNNSYTNFTFENALNFIEFETNVLNKVIIVPYGTSTDDFNLLEKKFMELYPNESYSLVLFGQEVYFNLYELLDYNKENSNISSVDIIEHYSGDSVRNIGKLLLHFSNYFNIGIVNLRRYQGPQYLGFPSTIYYWACGAKYCTFRDFSLDGGGGGGRKNYYKFNETTLLSEKLSDAAVEELRKKHKSKFYQVLRESNLDSIYSTMFQYKDYAPEDIRNLVEKRSGKVIY